MKLEAVVTCVDHADFLLHGLLFNKQAFNNMVVVTSPEDDATQRLCEYMHVKCVVTEAFDTAHGNFCKAAGINVGLKELDLDGWVLHYDADIVLPPQTRSILESATLDPRVIYGADRLNVQGYRDWMRHLYKPRLVQEADVYLHLDSFPPATRFYWPSAGGYLPIGFFQLWNPKGSGVTTYPEKHTDAGRADMLFAAKWPRERRGFLPEIAVYHLTSEAAPQGTNWRGRSTKPFAPADYSSWDWWLQWIIRWWRKHHPVPPPPKPYPTGGQTHA